MDSRSKKESIKNNLEYFWMYYKLPAAAVLLVVILAVYFAVSAWTAKETALSVMLIDCHTEVSGEQMADIYMKETGMDPKDHQVQIQNNLMFQSTDAGTYTMTSLSKFMADIGSGLLDVCGMLKEDFEKYDDAELWMDLEECLTREQYQTLEPYFVRAEDGRTIGLRADLLPQMQTDGCYSDGETEAVIGIVYNTPHQEEAVKYLLYLAGVWGK